MKSKLAVGAELWREVWSTISTLLPLLESYADPQSVLGKAVLNLCDPQTNENELGDLEVQWSYILLSAQAHIIIVMLVIFLFIDTLLQSAFVVLEQSTG
jgi:hypothetical protein